jgi:hypothetical protein
MRVSLLLLLAAACSSGVDVRGGVGDPRYDFKALRTYAWMPLEPTGDPRIDEAALDARVKKGVEGISSGGGTGSWRRAPTSSSATARC